MLVFVARSATGRKAHPRAPKVLSGEKRPRRCRDVLRCVAGTAAYVRVLAIQHIACRLVVESCRRRIPMDHMKVHAVVI